MKKIAVCSFLVLCSVLPFPRQQDGSSGTIGTVFAIHYSKVTARTYNNLAAACYANGDYDHALEYFNKALAIVQETLDEEDSEIGVYYRNIGDVYCAKGDYDRALGWYVKALDIFERTPGDSHQNTGLVYNSFGVAYTKKGDYDLALGYFSVALEIFREELGEDNPNTTACYNNIGSIYKEKGDYELALTYYNWVLKIWEKQFGKENLTTATAYNNIGDVYYSKGDYERALKYNFKALGIMEKELGKERPETAGSYNNIGLVYAAKGDYDQALDYYDKALAVWMQSLSEEHPSMAICYSNIGSVYSSKGDYDRALDYHRKALDIQRKISKNHPSTAKDYNNIGLAYHKKGDYEKALQYYGRALDVLTKVHGGEHPDMTGTYNNMGRVYDALGDYDRALECYRRAVDIWMQAHGELHPHTAELYNSIGHAYKGKGEYAKAQGYYGRGLTICRELLGDAHPSMARFYDSIGELCFDQGSYTEAASYWKKSWLSIQESKQYAESLGILKGQISSGISDTAFLRGALSLATDTVERARLDMSSMKEELLKDSLPIYYFGVDFEARENNPGKAFEYSEALRSRGFLDQMGTEAALRLNGVTDAERSQVQELVTQISVARKELEQQGNLAKDERDEERYKKAGSDLAQAERELAALDEAIGKRLPAYDQLRNPRAVDVKSAQKWCGRRRAVLEYVLPDPELNIGAWCILLMQEGVTAVQLDADFDYAAAVSRLCTQLTAKTGKTRRAEFHFERERNELYDRLIAPVLPMLSGKEELVIVPDGSLSMLPFDILRSDKNAPCLGDQYALALSPSISVSVIADPHRTRREGVLAFGGAWYDARLSEQEHRQRYGGTADGTGTDRGSLSTGFQLKADNEAQLAYMRQHILTHGPGDYFRQQDIFWKDLPGTMREVAALASDVFPSDIISGRTQKKASEAELKRLSVSGELARYSVLHLACHGYFDRNIAEMSSVLFSEVSGLLAGISAEDGYLTIPETAVLNLDADMVCLSACETGMGELRCGDGMVGLSRAFMVAGASRVGVSLWSIDDEATAEFMTRMYRKVYQEGSSYSRAYREVKAEFRADEKWKHPYYWAAFALYE